MAAGARSLRRDAPEKEAKSRDQFFSGQGGASLTFYFDGRPISALAGQSVAAALIAAGIRSWRIDEWGHHKGALCLIGYCFECRCRIDGGADRRA